MQRWKVSGNDYQITFTFEELKKATDDETIIEAMKQVDNEDNDYETLYVEIADELEDTIREIAAMDPYNVDWEFIGNDTIKLSYRVWTDEAE